MLNFTLSDLSGTTPQQDEALATFGGTSFDEENIVDSDKRESHELEVELNTNAKDLSESPPATLQRKQTQTSLQKQTSTFMRKQTTVRASDDEDSSSSESSRGHMPNIRSGGASGLICIITTCSLLLALMLELISDLEYVTYRYAALLSSFLALVCICLYPCCYLCGSVHCTYYECVKRFHLGYLLLVVCSVVSFSCLAALSVYRGLDKEFEDYSQSHCTILSTSEKSTSFGHCYMDIDVSYFFGVTNCTSKMFTGSHLHNRQRGADCDQDWTVNMKYACYADTQSCADVIQDTKKPHCEVDYNGLLRRNCGNLEFVSVFFFILGVILVVILCTIEHKHERVPNPAKMKITEPEQNFQEKEEPIHEHHVIVVDHKTQRQRPPGADELAFILEKIETSPNKKAIFQEKEDLLELEEEMKFETETLAKVQTDKEITEYEDDRKSESIEENDTEIELQNVGKPNMILKQRSGKKEEGRILHSDSGRPSEKTPLPTSDSRTRHPSGRSIGTFHDDLSPSVDRDLRQPAEKNQMELGEKSKRSSRKKKKKKTDRKND